LSGFDVAVIGGGIAGLAHAYAAAKLGRKVVLLERHERARGASVRNFGMIWPIGQPPATLPVALRSAEIWREVLDQTGVPSFRTGSIHAVYWEDEAQVAQEFAAAGPGAGYRVQWLLPEQAMAKSPALRAQGLRGALWSETELTVDPRQVIAELSGFLAERCGVELRYGSAVRAISNGSIETTSGTLRAERIIVCGGDDFETLYPDIFASSGITRVKLQMMRTAQQPAGWLLGPSLAAGLTLRFYKSFEICPSLPELKQRIAAQMPEYDEWGIHVLVSQNGAGQLTLGDSHEYGLEPDPFDKPFIDQLILRYLDTFLQAPDLNIVERWHGVYSKHPDKPWFHARPEPNVDVLTALGGAGMTLSFGLAEQNVREWNV
jgi:FAD dependent oxidoreductase TIGR03364